MKAHDIEHANAGCETLPEGMTRNTIIGVLNDTGHQLGMRDSLIRIAVCMIKHTAAEDWTSLDANPVCFASQTTIALKLGKTTRSIRKAEEDLQTLGLIRKETGADGARRSFASGAEPLGLNFAPLVSAAQALLDAKRQNEENVKYHQALRREISMRRRLLTTLASQIVAEDGQHPFVETLTAKAALRNSRYDDMGLGQLEALLADVEEMVLAARQVVDELKKESGMPDQDDRHHTEHTNDHRFVSVGARKVSDASEPQGLVAHDAWDDGESSANADCGNVQNPRELLTQQLANFSNSMLVRAASADFAEQLEAMMRAKPGDPIGARVLTAEMFLSPLGINRTAWDDAVSVMGRDIAAICVMIIDANRTHPVTPIHKPGGALRAFTRRASAGELNLRGSLIGLIARSKAHEGEKM